MGRAGALFLACLKIAAGSQHLHYARGQLLWGLRPALPAEGSEGLSFEIYCINASPVSGSSHWREAWLQM